MVTDEKGRINADLVTEEMIAEVTARVLTLDETFMKNFANEDRGFVQKVIDAVKEFFDKVIGRYKGENPGKMSPEIKEAVKMLEGERAKILRAYNNMLKATQKNQGYKIKGAESGSVMHSNKKNIANSVGVMYNKQYWRTDLNKTQLKMVEQWIQKAGAPDSKRITDTACWYKGRINGEDLFVIYSTENLNKPTILYEVKGGNANRELDILTRALEVIESERSAIEKSRIIDELLGSNNQVQKKHDMANNNAGSRGRGSNTRYAPVLQGKSPKFIGSPAFREVVKNIFDIQEKTGILKSKPDTGTTSTESDSGPLGRLEIDVEAQKRIDEAVKKYGAMKKGVAPTRDVTLPKRTEDDRYVRQTTRTALDLQILLCGDSNSGHIAKAKWSAIFHLITAFVWTTLAVPESRDTPTRGASLSSTATPFKAFLHLPPAAEGFKTSGFVSSAVQST